MNKLGIRMSSEAINKDDILLKQLEEFLECNVCLNVPDTAPIYQCDNGHLFCKNCIMKLSSCPCCRGQLSRIRNLLAEKILDKIPTGCRFKDYGCDVILPREDLPTHSKGCKFREVMCPRRLCKKMICLDDVADHFELVHLVRFPTEVSKPLHESFHYPVTILWPAFESNWELDFQLHFNGVYFFP